jgi:hypothetical protein
MESIADDADILGKLESLADGDRARQRTNPFAVASQSGELVTADEVRVAGRDQYAAGFRCPKCKGSMRHYVGKNGTPFFAHASSRGNCPTGRETPAHLCIKRGLHSVGFDCEITDSESGYIWDAIHRESATVAEVVCSGIDRYRPKIADTSASETTCWWILDSAAPGLCSQFGSERICLSSFSTSGTVVVEGLFKPKVMDVFLTVGEGCLFAFYLGLIWRSLGADRWQLLDESHALSKAATADDGMKHLMVKMKVSNSHVVTQNRRLNIDRKTWFDSTFRFRGHFSMTWNGDRDYVMEMVRQLIRDLNDTGSVVLKKRSFGSSAVPGAPTHASAEDIIHRINQRHSASVDEIASLRQIAQQSCVTSPLDGAAVANSRLVPLVIATNERQHILANRSLTSSRWANATREDTDARQRRRVNEANRKLLEAASERRPGGLPSYYLNNY